MNDQKAAVKQHSRNNQHLEQRTSNDHYRAKATREEQLNDKGKIPAKQILSSNDSGIDTGTVCSSNITPDRVRGNKAKNDHKMELKGNILEIGVDNKGYDEDSDDSTIENNLAKHNFKPYPDPDERINLLQFQELKNKYFQVDFESEGLLVDKAIPSIVFCCTTVSAEVLGLLKIPLL